MDEQIKQIAIRLKGLRDVLDLTTQDVAQACGISEEKYIALESGEQDIPVSILHQISLHYGIDLSALMFGDEPRMNAYFLTRKGKGAAPRRHGAHLRLRRDGARRQRHYPPRRDELLRH